MGWKNFSMTAEKSSSSPRAVGVPNLEEPIRLPSPHRINVSVRLSVCLFVRLLSMKTRRIFM
jgi:hypothetical protein